MALRIAGLLSIGVALLAAAAQVAAGELRTIDVQGKPVEVYVPTPLPLQLSADGRLAQGGRLPRILIADPDTTVAPMYVPRRVPRADAAADPTATFLIEYVAAGGTDAFGEPCFAFPAQAQTVINAAVAIWAEEIVSSVPIRIRACWASLGGSTLGYSGGGPLHRDFAGAPLAGTWYGAALANSLAGVDLNVSAADMHITYSAGFAWYFGTDGAPPGGQMDLLTVVLHEVGHGLDFAGTADVNGGLGRWGFGSAFPSIYDRFVYDGAGTPLLNTAVYPNNSAALASLLTSQSVWFRGAHAMTANGGLPVKLYAPTTWLPGSSYSHLDYATFVGTTNRLMVYALSAGVAVHDPGPVTLGLLRDLGWSLNPGTPTYTLNVASTGVSGVAVTATPSAYAGTTNYSRTGIASRTNISLTAPAQSGGGGFTAWAGCDSTSGTTCTLVMNAARSVTAGYASYVVNISASPAGGGSASCSPNPVPHAGLSTCTATANAGYTFSAFSGDCTGATCTLSNVTGPRSVTANFTLNSYAITAVANPAGGGTVTCSPNPVPHASSSTCTATANAGYTVSSFSGDCTGPTCTLSNVTGVRSVTANFTLNSYPITTVANPAGGGTVTCSPNPVPHAGSSTCTATANAGYAFSAFSGDCTGATCTLSNVTGPRSVTANFLAAQTITFAVLPDKVYGDPPIALSASASSGLTVAFDSQSPAVCSVAGTQLTLLSAGTCAVRATQAGNTAYLPAPPVARSFAIARAASSTSVAATPVTVAVGASVVLTATVTGVAPTGAVSFRLHNAPLAGCGAVALTGTGGTRTAQCASSPLAQGVYAFMASYAGDTSHFGSSAATNVTVTPLPGLACVAFTDVDSASPFCPNVDWLRNRAITLGCTATTYCPTSPVNRLAMAAFMNRLGTALTGLPMQAIANSGALDPDASPVVCTSDPIAAAGFVRAVILDGVLTGESAGNADVSIELVASPDGLAWSPVTSATRITVAAGRVINVRVQGDYDALAGETMRFGMRITRASGTGSLSASACRLRATLNNRNGTFSPYDAGQ